MSMVLGKMREAYEADERLQVLVEYLAVLDAVLLAAKVDLGECDVERMREVLEWQVSLKEKCHALYAQLVGNGPREGVVGLMDELEAAVAEGETKYNVQVRPAGDNK